MKTLFLSVLLLNNAFAYGLWTLTKNPVNVTNMNGSMSGELIKRFANCFNGICKRNIKSVKNQNETSGVERETIGSTDIKNQTAGSTEVENETVDATGVVEEEIYLPAQDHFEEIQEAAEDIYFPAQDYFEVPEENQEETATKDNVPTATPSISSEIVETLSEVNSSPSKTDAKKDVPTASPTISSERTETVSGVNSIPTNGSSNSAVNNSLMVLIALWAFCF